MVDGENRGGADTSTRSTWRRGFTRDRTLVVYGWGPGCNGATHTARRLLAEGFDVREMVGGYEYWVRNGFAVERDGMLTREAPDPLVTAER